MVGRVYVIIIIPSLYNVRPPDLVDMNGEERRRRVGHATPSSPTAWLELQRERVREVREDFEVLCTQL